MINHNEFVSQDVSTKMQTCSDRKTETLSVRQLDQQVNIAPPKWEAKARIPKAHLLVWNVNLSSLAQYGISLDIFHLHKQHLPTLAQEVISYSFPSPFIPSLPMW